MCGGSDIALPRRSGRAWEVGLRTNGTHNAVKWKQLFAPDWPVVFYMSFRDAFFTAGHILYVFI